MVNAHYPSKHNAFVKHLHDVGPASSTLSQHCAHAVRMFCVCLDDSTSQRRHFMESRAYSIHTTASLLKYMEEYPPVQTLCRRCFNDTWFLSIRCTHNMFQCVVVTSEIMTVSRRGPEAWCHQAWQADRSTINKLHHLDRVQWTKVAVV